MLPLPFARIALGAMRLSTTVTRDETVGIAVLHAAFDAGITLVDTADAYCHDASEVGHNERLIRQALGAWSGNRAAIRVATKGGLTRPDGLWVADGRARHLRAACEASLVALGVERIALYQLHAPDPRTPLATSVRALDGLQRDGLVESIGLSNVTVGQIEAARQIVEIASVQVELSVLRTDALVNGVADFCIRHNIRLLAHRPLGGVDRRQRIASDPVLVDVAREHLASPFEVALAWLLDLSPAITVIPGATKVETVASIARAREIALTDSDRERLDERFPAGRRLRGGPSSTAVVAPRRRGEIVLIMGIPASGKSTVAETFVAQGYARLNRDASGGTLAALELALDSHIRSGTSRVVLDNTYVTRKARAGVVSVAAQHGLAVRCLSLDTPLEDAQVNACGRIIGKYRRLLTPEEMRLLSKKDVAAFPPSVQFRYQRDLEPPDASEGFASIEHIAFNRLKTAEFDNRALITWCDDTLWRSRSGRRVPTSADDVEVPAGRGDVLRRYRDEGWKLCGLSWQPDLGDNDAAFRGTVERLQELLGVSIDVEHCPHPAGPPICWCRKPLPGLGVLLINRHRLNPAASIYVGGGSLDPGFARRLGFQYRTVEEVFG